MDSCYCWLKAWKYMDEEDSLKFLIGVTDNLYCCRFQFSAVWIREVWPYVSSGFSSSIHTQQMLWFQRIMGIQKKGLLVVFSECMFLILFHLWGSCAFCIIIHQVLSSFLLSISPICHLFTLIAFEVPMSIFHLECCDSPSYHVSLPLVSPFLQTILHIYWSNGHILSCHFLFWIL